MNPRVKAIYPLDNYNLKIEFLNGEIKIFNVEPYLKYPAYSSLKNLNYFKLVRVNSGTAVWQNEEDFCPDTLYLESTSF